jgi:hypothetical protein
MPLAALIWVSVITSTAVVTARQEKELTIRHITAKLDDAAPHRLGVSQQPRQES